MSKCEKCGEEGTLGLIALCDDCLFDEQENFEKEREERKIRND